MSDLTPFQTPGHARATVAGFLKNRFGVEFRVIDANTAAPRDGDWRGAACRNLVRKKRTVVCHNAVTHAAAADTVVAAMLASPRAKVGAVYAFPFCSEDGTYRATLCGVATKPAVGTRRLDTKLVRLLARFLAGLEPGRSVPADAEPRPAARSGVN